MGESQGAPNRTGYVAVAEQASGAPDKEHAHQPAPQANQGILPQVRRVEHISSQQCASQDEQDPRGVHRGILGDLPVG